MKFSTIFFIFFLIIISSCYGLKRETMNTLTDHQRLAISKYLSFMNKYPKCFKHRKYRNIISDRKILEIYSREHDVVLGMAVEDPYVYFIVDLVEMNSEGGKLVRFPYLRLINRKELDGAVNTVVLGTIENPELGETGSIVLLNQERHATGYFHLELPRGFGEANLSGEENAVKELEEETGYIGKRAELIGISYTDTGLTDSKVLFYHILITDRVEAKPELEEAISKVYVKSEDELINMIRKEEITDSFTIQAISFYRINKNK